MFKPVGSLLNGVLGGSKAREAALAVGLRQKAQDVVKRRLKSCPEDVLSQVKVKNVKNGVLTISGPAAVSGEIHMSSKDLIKEINASLKTNAIKKLRIKVL